MSSRSLAAARSKRAGETAPPVSGNRPGTSIGSHAAFAPQQQTPPSYNHNAQPNNVRTGRTGQQQMTQQQMTQQQMTQQPPQPPQIQKSVDSKQVQQTKAPFTKLTVSDAVGLITLRLGRLEQWVIDTEHENDNSPSGSFNLPENSKIIDSSILNNIISRLDALEKRESGTNNNEEISKLLESVSKFTDQITKIVEEGNKHSLAISKHTEQLFKFEREFVETKDLLKTFMIKYDMFTNDTNAKFTDYEFALTELEKSVQLVDTTIVSVEEVEGSNIEDIDTVQVSDIADEVSNDIASQMSNDISLDLKNIIKQEFAVSN
jgi:hypothetical protein